MAKKSKPPIFWIHGNLRQCRRTWNEIVEHVSKQSGQKPDIQVMFGGINPINAPASQRWSTADDVVFALRNNSFGDGPRIIKICGLPESYTELADWFHILNGSNVLVIQSAFGYIKPGPSKRWITAKNSKFYKKVKAEGFLIEHPIEAKSDNDATDWVVDVAKEFKKEIKRLVAREVVAKEGKNLDALENAVIKLCSYQKGKEITVESVYECCSGGFRSEDVWQFIEDLDFRRDERALVYLQGFYAEGDGAVGESFAGRVGQMFGALKQHFQFLMVLNDRCSGRDLSADILEGVLSNFKKMTPTKILELQKGEITYEDFEPRFSKSYINFNIRKDSVRFAFRKKKSEIYRNLAMLYDCMYLCRKERKNSGDDYRLRLYLDTFALAACGRLSSQQVNQIYGIMD